MNATTQDTTKPRAVTSDGVPVWCAFDTLCDPQSLVDYPDNPNIHPPEQLAALRSVIEENGWREAIVVSRLSGRITKGHGRKQAALRGDPWQQVPVEYQDYADEDAERADVVADNALAQKSKQDAEALRKFLESVDFETVNSSAFGLTADEIKAINAPAPTDADAEPQIDRAEELRAKWKTERGQVWQLGEHRLMCGDSETDDVGILLWNDRPHLMVTDPPYGVNYKADWRNKALGEGCQSIGEVQNDDKADWRTAWDRFPGDVAYVWHAGTKSTIVFESLVSSGFDIRCQIIWAKQHFAIGRGHYHVQHEPCWYAVRKGSTGHWNDDRTQSTLWQIKNGLTQGGPRAEENELTGHSTQKPVECMERPIRNNSRPGDSVYDPFLGSGTTLIACERTGRRCVAMELSPAYVAVTLQRWIDATGKTPVLL